MDLVKMNTKQINWVDELEQSFTYRDFVVKTLITWVLEEGIASFIKVGLDRSLSDQFIKLNLNNLSQQFESIKVFI